MMVRKERTILVVGDRVLIRLENESEKTPHGLFLPPGVAEREKIQTGHIVKVGPGYPIPNPNYNDDEPWAPQRELLRYMPLQAQEGDYALFLRHEAIEVEYEGEQYVIVPHPAILMLVREELHEQT